jgi:hypothetical protein
MFLQSVAEVARLPVAEMPGTLALFRYRLLQSALILVPR